MSRLASNRTRLVRRAMRTRPSFSTIENEDQEQVIASTYAGSDDRTKRNAALHTPHHLPTYNRHTNKTIPVNDALELRGRHAKGNRTLLSPAQTGLI